MQLKSMSLDRLRALREQVDTALKTRIAGARSDLEARLKELSDFGSSERTGRQASRGRVPPKYRNPDNPSETWTGRGRQPRWLAAALKRGGRLEDFLIEGGSVRRREAAAKPRKAKTARKQAKPRKTAKARKAAKPRKTAMKGKVAKPLKARMTQSPPAAPPTPTPATTDGQSEAQTPAA
jgi:DNA-binding protein H-NS